MYLGDQFTVSEFIDALKDKSWAEIRAITHQSVSAMGRRMTTRTTHRTLKDHDFLRDSATYEVVKGFGFVVNHANSPIRPMGVSEQDWQQFKPIFARAVQNGELPDDYLKLFA